MFEEEPSVVTPTGVAAMHRARWRAYLWLELCATETPEDVQQFAAFNALTAGTCEDAAFAEEVMQHMLRWRMRARVVFLLL